MKYINKNTLFTCYFLFILLIIILADLNKIPVHLLSLIPHYDWLAHFVLYGLFCRILEGCLEGKGVRIFNRQFSQAFLLTLVFIITEEVSQIFFVSRTFSMIDLIMGFLGVIIINFILIPIHSKKPARQ